MDSDVIALQKYEANVCREIKVLNLLDHPAIIRFVGAFDTKQSTYIVLEYMANGDLQQVNAPCFVRCDACQSFIRKISAVQCGAFF